MYKWRWHTRQALTLYQSAKPTLPKRFVPLLEPAVPGLARCHKSESFRGTRVD